MATTRYDVAEHLRTPEEITLYLREEQASRGNMIG